MQQRNGLAGSGVGIGIVIHIVALGLATLAPGSLHAQVEDPFSIEVEGAAVFQSRNTVQIPNDPSATRFSLVDAIGNGPFGAIRFEAAFDVAEKHGFRLVIAPLAAEDEGSLEGPVNFAGARFAAGAVEATYEFSSYRVTYRYRFYEGDRWRFRIGFTGFVRDARVALEQAATEAEDNDVGFVPLGYFQAEARLGEDWSFRFDVDGLGASQGRAFDISTKLARSLGESWELGIGYRTIEGGANVESVYNFAWLHFAVASLRYTF